MIYNPLKMYLFKSKEYYYKLHELEDGFRWLILIGSKDSFRQKIYKSPEAAFFDVIFNLKEKVYEVENILELKKLIDFLES